MNVIYEGTVPSKNKTFFTDYSALSDLVLKELAGKVVHRTWHPGGSGDTITYHIHSRHATLVHMRETFVRPDYPTQEREQMHAKVVLDGNDAAVRELSELILNAAKAYEDNDDG